MKDNKNENKILVFLKRLFGKKTEIKMLSEKNEVISEKKEFSLDYEVKNSFPQTYDEIVARIKVGTLKLNEISREELLHIEKICMQALAKKEEKVRLQMEQFRKQNAVN